MKKVIVMIMAAAVMLTALPAMDAMAGGKAGCGYKIDLEQKLYKKAMFLMTNKRKLGLADSQVNDIMKIKVNAKKELIDKKAEIDKLKVDIMAEMYGEDMDTDKVKELIERKYELKKQKALFLVDSCVSMKDVLDSEQRQRAKDLWMTHGKKAKAGKMEGYHEKKEGRHMM
ncbi:MAG: hypothetical protein GF392_06480 [Candidatus Omnitrophica bacterium]|nr:hypothetical protein [Candidatus Omnitrophota bacterium]